MVGFEQYPHTIVSESGTNKADATQDVNGNWVIPAPGATVTTTSECRAKPNGEGKTVNGEDGVAIAYDFLIYLPQTAPEFFNGASVTIDGFGKGLVKRFFRGQLNCMMWV